MPPPPASPKILIVGAGPAGLFAAETLARAGKSVVVADGAPQPGRKFLLAGRGGLNLTHSEPLEAFLDRYGPARARLEPAIRAFGPDALREWAAGLGEPTFVGSSGRVFPKSFRSTPLLRAWLARLAGLGVALRTRWRWLDFEDGASLFATPEGETRFEAKATVLALGGASWPRLGADGAWTGVLSSKGIAITPLSAANVGFRADWSNVFRERFAGTLLKGALWRVGGATSRAEAVVTREGLEGGAVYALGPAIRGELAERGVCDLTLDLKPDRSEAQLAEKLLRRSRDSLSNRLRKDADLFPVAIGLMREAGPLVSDGAALAKLIKSCPLRLVGVGGLARAISTAGGVDWRELSENFEFLKAPGLFAAGEMIDWEAPTGGYLLQACFATGRAAAEGALAFLGR